MLIGALPSSGVPNRMRSALNATPSLVRANSATDGVTRQLPPTEYDVWPMS